MPICDECDEECEDENVYMIIAVQQKSGEVHYCADICRSCLVRKDYL